MLLLRVISALGLGASPSIEANDKELTLNAEMIEFPGQSTSIADILDRLERAEQLAGRIKDLETQLATCATASELSSLGTRVAALETPTTPAAPPSTVITGRVITAKSAATCASSVGASLASGLTVTLDGQRVSTMPGRGISAVFFGARCPLQSLPSALVCRAPH